MRRILLVISMLYLAWAVPAHAEGPKSYSLSEVVQLAREKNPSLAVFQANLKAARGDAVSAGAFPNPSLELEFGRGRATRDGDLDRREYRFTLEQPLELPNKRLHRKKVAETGQAAARGDVSSFHLQLVFEVKQAFYHLLLAQKDLETVAGIAAASEEALNRMKLRVEAGDAPEVDLFKTRVELLKIRKEQRATEREVLGFRASLNGLTGNALGTDFTVTGDFTGAAGEVDPQKLTETALARHPLIERQKQHIAGKEASLALERASRMGDMSVKAFYGQEIDKELYGAGVSIPLPLWYGRSGEIAAASARLDGARAALEALKVDIAVEVARRSAEVQAALARADAFEQGLLRDAKETLDIAAFSFEQGETSLLELLDARRTHATVLREHIESLYELAVAVARLEQATGGDVHE